MSSGSKHRSVVVRFFFAFALFFVSAMAADAQPSKEAVQWRELVRGVGAAYQAREYVRALELAQEAYNLAKQTFGLRHPNTLTSLNNLAVLYRLQGRYGEAEELLKKALQLSRETSGERHPDTLVILNNLAGLYESQGRYGEAEALLQQALQVSRETFGERHPRHAHYPQQPGRPV